MNHAAGTRRHFVPRARGTGLSSFPRIILQPLERNFRALLHRRDGYC